MKGVRLVHIVKKRDERPAKIFPKLSVDGQGVNKAVEAIVERRQDKRINWDDVSGHRYVDHQLVGLIVANFLGQRARSTSEGALNSAEKLRYMHSELRKFCDRV